MYQVNVELAICSLKIIIGLILFCILQEDLYMYNLFETHRTVLLRQIILTWPCSRARILVQNPLSCIAMVLRYYLTTMKRFKVFKGTRCCKTSWTCKIANFRGMLFSCVFAFNTNHKNPTDTKKIQYRPTQCPSVYFLQLEISNLIIMDGISTNDETL